MTKNRRSDKPVVSPQKRNKTPLDSKFDSIKGSSVIDVPNNPKENPKIPQKLEMNNFYDEEKQLALPFESSISIASPSEVEMAIKSILSEHETIEENFYRTIDPKEEFGISRTVADKLYHLPKLLAQPELVWQEGTTTYIIKSSTPDSQGNTITLEHRLQASSHEEAQKIAAIVTDRLRGILHKIHIASWKLANELRRFTFTCQMTELMHLCYPDRAATFQTHEKTEFYEHLRALENTKIIYSRKKPSKKPSKERKNDLVESIEIRLIEIHNKIGQKQEYPQAITISVFNAPLLQNEKLAFVGAGFKHTTLTLHAEVISLAAWLQARKAQHKDSNGKITVEESYLLKVAGLEKTALKNKSLAKIRLNEKLRKCAERGIIEFPVEKEGSNLIIRYQSSPRTRRPTASALEN